MKLSEFIAALRKRSKDFVLVSGIPAYDKSVHVEINGKLISWLYVDFDQDGNFNVHSLRIRNDINDSRHLEVVAAIAGIGITTTNQKEIDDNENASV